MTTIKINWGVRVTLLYLGFMAIIIVLVVGSMRQEFDLVAPDYYEQELAYQQVLDAGKNQASLSAPVSISANSTALNISFPAEFKGKQLAGKINFYSPVNAAWDKEVLINTEENKISIDRADLKNTSYNIRISWSADGKSYYQQSDINLHQ